MAEARSTLKKYITNVNDALRENRYAEAPDLQAFSKRLGQGYMVAAYFYPEGPYPAKTDKPAYIPLGTANTPDEAEEIYQAAIEECPLLNQTQVLISHTGLIHAFPLLPTPGCERVFGPNQDVAAKTWDRYSRARLKEANDVREESKRALRQVPKSKELLQQPSATQETE